MICLGIESTAHTFGISVVRDKDKKVLSNIITAFKTKSGGLVPAKVADHHIDVLEDTFVKALETAGIKAIEIDLIAFSQGPGIGNTLRIGAGFARSLSLLLNKPLIGVNHCIAHLEVGRFLTKAKDPVLLYASGANTQVIAYEAGKYRVFGETLDLGIGNFLDTFARNLGLGFPGGPKIEELAKKSKHYIKLPYVVKGMDISLGGLETNLKNRVHQGKDSKEDLCFSVQETVFAMLIEVAERAMAHTGKTELLLGGGVACNKRLQEMSRIMCEERGAKLFLLENQFFVDNAAMIAITGIEMHKAGVKTPINKSEIRPYERTDDVDVKWR
ncbi:MAG: bifunctional N(6)-L-threonylcarbamoyladenine synthase/serine/threonine protein kinase [Nanoarchaeota archaeon]|nr:bifunctional N(6)-L-threonylcarbamoyladenine synthase/serine/threonine protein kinase [Nanoarchaeota archaeon]MBU1321734.1 bifunctional N(6)-L-threonylcarbamoyladenine synthase/serine/threonine protein kinase [Nanoarchaeota archaeon]MBU1597700.1 bifunctional N(6)-L-threonylcarbamoyladenine synthase/serine/threonine protein kinase [Nanoarchaeota archaeon]MBU2440738.1 bifunctional N(6)-L-threonylcarbamoyladenine synthase/serine/threonine protein kinase [Nanoarchaeota archaeon]